MWSSEGWWSSLTYWLHADHIYAVTVVLETEHDTVTCKWSIGHYRIIIRESTLLLKIIIIGYRVVFAFQMSASSSRFQTCASVATLEQCWWWVIVPVPGTRVCGYPTVLTIYLFEIRYVHIRNRTAVFDERLPVFHVFNKVSGVLFYFKTSNNTKIIKLF